MARNTLRYKHHFACYGMPLRVEVKIKKHPEVAKEGGQKKFCRECVNMAVTEFRKQLLAALNDLQLR